MIPLELVAVRNNIGFVLLSLRWGMVPPLPPAVLTPELFSAHDAEAVCGIKALLVHFKTA